jgi:hypothetical protein
MKMVIIIKGAQAELGLKIPVPKRELGLKIPVPKRELGNEV